MKEKKICFIDKCKNKHYAKGLCVNHYIKQKKNIDMNYVRTNILNDNPNWKGGQSLHPFYGVYNAMINRCYNKNDKFYKDYGERSIMVCDKWKEDFWSFVKDIGDRPIGYLLDRIDNDKGYFPENCRWVDKITSANNKRKINMKNRLRNIKGQFI